MRDPETKCERCQVEIEDCFLATVSRNPRDLANALNVEVEVFK